MNFETLKNRCLIQFKNPPSLESALSNLLLGVDGRIQIFSFMNFGTSHETIVYGQLFSKLFNIIADHIF